VRTAPHSLVQLLEDLVILGRSAPASVPDFTEGQSAPPELIAKLRTYPAGFRGHLGGRPSRARIDVAASLEGDDDGPQPGTHRLGPIASGSKSGRICAELVGGASRFEVEPRVPAGTRPAGGAAATDEEEREARQYGNDDQQA
jgi:hypothetical protein